MIKAEGFAQREEREGEWYSKNAVQSTDPTSPICELIYIRV